MAQDDYDFIPFDEFGGLSGSLLGETETLDQGIFEPFDAGPKPSQQPKPDGFEEGAQEAEKAAEATRINAVVEEEKEHSLDALSEMGQLAKELQIPLPLVEANVEDARLARDTQRARQILELAPKLKALVTDPEKGKGLSSSIHGMSAFEIMVDDWDVGFSQGERIVEMGKLAYKAMGEKDPKLAFQYLMEAKDVRRQMGESRETESIFGGVGIVGSVGEQIGLLKEVVPEVLKLGAAGAAINAPFFTPGGPAAVATGAAVGFTAGAAAGTMRETAQIEAGALYLDLLADGVDAEAAKYIANSVGVVNGALEVVGVTALAKPISAPAKKLLNKIIIQEAKKLFKEKTKGQALRNILKSYAAAVGSEIAVELAQEGTGIAGSEFGRAQTEGLDPKMFTEEGRAELGAQVLGVLEKTVKSVPFIAAPGMTLNAYSELRDVKKAKDTELLMKGLGDHAGSELAEKLPAQFREVIKEATKDGPLENVYIDANKLQEYYQDETSAVIEEMGLENEMEEALGVPDGFVKVPLGVYAETIARDSAAHNALLMHSKFEPLGETPAYVQALQQQEGLMLKEAEKLMQQGERSEEINSSGQQVYEGMRSQLLAAGQSESEAHSNAMLHQAFAVTQAKNEGVQPHELYESLGLNVVAIKKPKEITEEQAAQGYPSAEQLQSEGFDGVRVIGKDGKWKKNISLRELQGAKGATQTLDQQALAVKRTPEFQSFFEGSQIVDEADEPLVVYHGTQADEDFGVFNTETDFDLGAHFGTTEQANDRLGTLADWRKEEPLSKVKSAIGMDVKENRESRIVPVYLSIKNPLRMNDAGDFSDPSQVLQAIQEAAIPYEAYKAIKDVVDKGQNIKAVKNKMEELGYDGVVYQNQAEGPGDSYIAFHPEQIKSIFNERPTDSPDILNQEVRSRGLYSAVEQAFQDMKIPAWKKENGEANGKDVWAKLKTMPGIKQEEIKWLGVEEFLTGNPKAKFTRQEVISFAEQNGVTVETVVADQERDENFDGIQWTEQRVWDDPEAWQNEIEDAEHNGIKEDAFNEVYEGNKHNIPKELEDDNARNEWIAENYESEIEEQIEAIAQGRYMTDPVYIVESDEGIDLSLFGNDDLGWSVRRGGWQLHENTVSDEPIYSLNEAQIQAEDYARENDLIRDEGGASVAKWSDYTMPGYMENYRELKLTLPDIGEEFYEDKHFPDPNIVAFLRVNDRELGANPLYTQAIGPGEKKLNTYFIDEFQSDWHQQGRQRGYSTGEEDAGLLEAKGNKKQAALFEDIIDEVPRVFEGKDALEMGAGNGNASFDAVLTELLANNNQIPDEMAGRQDGRVTPYINMQKVIEKSGRKDEFLERFKEQAQLYKKAQAERYGVPDAPFKGDSWMALGLKQAILDAVDNGYEAIAWADSDVISNRWSERFEKLYRMQYDKKMPAIVKRLTGIESTHIDKKIFNETLGGEPTGYHIIPITPELKQKVRSEGFTLFQSQPGQARVTPNWYYSQLAESFNALPDKKTQPQSAKGWKQVIKKLGIKNQELEWTGIFEWLDTKTHAAQILDLEEAIERRVKKRDAYPKGDDSYNLVDADVSRLQDQLAKEKAGKGPKITKSQISNWLFNNGVKVETVEVDSGIGKDRPMSAEEYEARFDDVLEGMLSREVEAKINMLVEDEIFRLAKTDAEGASIVGEPVEVTRKRIEEENREAIEEEVYDMGSDTYHNASERAGEQVEGERESEGIEEIGADLTPYTFEGGTDESSLLLKIEQRHPRIKQDEIIIDKLWRHAIHVRGTKNYEPMYRELLLFDTWQEYINVYSHLPGHKDAKNVFTKEEEKFFDDNIKRLRTMYPRGPIGTFAPSFESHVFREHGNIVTWIRKQTREENGKKILFIDEIQSDFEGAVRSKSTTAQAPFTDSQSAYVGLAMKKVITYAVENDFDRVEWTSGSQQSERYRSELIDNASRMKYNPKTKQFSIVRPGNLYWVDVAKIEQKNLPSMVGKDVARTLLEEPLKDGAHLIETGNVEISDKGMVDFYDRLIPDVAVKMVKSITGEKKVIEYEDPAPDSYDPGRQPGFDLDGVKAAFEGSRPSLALFQEKRGSFQFGEDITAQENYIKIFEGGDLSTFLHESGHFFFEALRHLANQPGAKQQTKDDMQTLLKAVGVSDVDTWNKMSLEERRNGHETIARSFEAYLFTGVAPTLELAEVFRTFKDWLVEVYRSLRRINANPSEDVRSVFDRMLATEEQIQSTRRTQGSMPMFESNEDMFSKDEWDAYRELVIAGDATAQELLDAKTLRAMRWVHGARGEVLSGMQREHREQRQAVKDVVTKETADLPLYRALAWLRQPVVKKKKVKGSRKEVVPELDSLHTAIAKLGGIKKEDLIADWGMDPQTKFKTFRSVAKKDDGLDIDGMAELLAELGYLKEDETGKWDLREFEDKFFDEISGRKHYSVKNDQFEAAESYEDEWMAHEIDKNSPVLTPEDVPHEKISIESLERLYSGEERIYESLPVGRWGIIGEEGLDVELVAQIFKFASGEEMIREMVNAQPMNEVIEAQTDVRMQELFSEIHTPEQREKAATLAIRNEARTRLVHAELSALTKGVGDRNILRAAAQDLAEQKISEMKIDEIKPEKYIAAERRSNRMAEIALGKGNRDEAIELKRAAILHYHFSKVAAKAVEEVERGVNYTNRLDSKAARKAIPTEYTDQIDQLLEPYDLRKSVTKKDRLQRMALSAWIAKQKDMGFSPAIDEKWLQESLLSHYKDLPLEEFRDLIDAVKSIEHLGRIEGKVLLDEQRRDLNQVVGELVSSIDAHRADQKAPTREPRLPWNKAKSFAQGVFASHKKFSNIIRWFDGFKDGGIGYQVLQRPLQERTNWASAEKAKATTALADIFSVFGFKERSKLYTPVFIEEINESLSKSAMLAVALNWGNAINRQRIMGGEKWGHVQIQAIMDRLSKKEMDFVQSVWDYYDTFWEAVAAKEKRVSGVAPTKVEPLPVYTKHGTYRGGYHPIKFSPERSNEAFKHMISAAEETGKLGAFGRGMTKRDHAKERVEGEVNIAMRLDLDVVFEHVTEVIQDLAFHEYLIDAGRILNHEDFHAAVVTKYNDAIFAQLKATTADVALGEVPVEGAMNHAFGYIRHGSTISSLAMNLGTMLLQPIGLTQSIVRIGPKWVARGFARWIRGPEGMQNALDFIQERSEFMVGRKDNINREVNELRNKVHRAGVTSELRGQMGDHYFILIAKAQLIADIPTWLGMYEKIMEEGVNGVQVDEEMAISLADSAVKDAQGAGDMMDRAGVQKGSEAWKMFTNFYSFFNVLYNLTADSVHRTNFKSPGSIGLLAVDMMLLYWLPATLGFLLREALIRGECEHGTDLVCVAKKSVTETLSYMMGAMVGLRELGGAVSGAWGYSGPAGSRFFSAATRLIQQAKQGESDEALWKAAGETFGILFHVPGVQAERTMRAIANGDWTRLFGEPKD